MSVEIDGVNNIIKTNTISEVTSANGVSIDSVKLKDSTIDVNGASDGIILDADADTTISAPTDDQIDFKIAGADDLKMTANAINVLSGTTLTIDSGATITNSGTANNFGTTTIGGLTDVTMDATNFTDGILIQPNSDGSAPTTGTLSSALRNVGIGKEVFTALTSGDENVAIGPECGKALTTGSHNVLVGNSSGDVITTGARNIVLGGDAGGALTEGDDNVFIGAGAGGAVTTAHDIIAIGNRAYDVGTTDTNNIAIGKDTLGSSNFGGGSDNIVIGNGAGDAVNTGDENTLVGYLAGTTIEGGSGNTCIGNDSAATLGSGSNNTIIGNSCNVNDATTDHGICIGNNIETSSNKFSFGKSGDVVSNVFSSNANWSRSSDIRKKREIYDQGLGLDFINDLRTVNFQWKPQNEFPKEWADYNEISTNDTSVVMHGFIAQEVKEALDKHASKRDSVFAGWSEGEDGMQHTSREMFVIPLIKAVQELSTEVKELKAKLEDK